jgi:nucleoside-diphosphate-sugar epimerase
MTTILLTGASGFIGTQVLAALLRRGHSVHAIDRKKPSGIDNAGVTWHSVNLLDRDSIAALLESVRPEGLIHLAWETKHGFYWRSPSNLEWLSASLLMLHDFSRFGGKRVVIAGSSAEYQWGGLDDLNETESPIIPDSLYGASKNALREVTEKWAAEVSMSWAWARFFNVFGPGEESARLLPRVTCTLLDGKLLPFDSGAIVRDFMHVADAGDAVAALFQSEVQGPVNIASGEALSVHDVISIIANHLHAGDLVAFKTQPDQAELPARVVACVDRLRHEVKWQSQASLASRLSETCEWWRVAKKN